MASDIGTPGGLLQFKTCQNRRLMAVTGAPLERQAEDAADIYAQTDAPLRARRQAYIAL